MSEAIRDWRAGEKAWSATGQKQYFTSTEFVYELVLSTNLNNAQNEPVVQGS